VLVVAVPFIYIHFIQADPPPSLTFQNRDAASTTVPASSASSAAGSAGTAANAPATSGDASGAASGAATTSVDGAVTVTTGAEAGYRVKEVLFGQSTEAVGRTSTVTGDMTIANDTVTTGSFSVDLRTVTSDETQRDRQFQGPIMHTSQFPM